jgi:pimeloyl-ACP methyl ester carboxylesterase
VGGKSKPAVVRETTQLNRIASADGSVSLALLERRPPRQNPLLPPMLLLHGATLGACVFDLPLAGYSLMAEMASRGRSVYAVDIRGFGNSCIEPADGAGVPSRVPFPSITEAVADLGAAVTAILARERVEAIDLIGFSWGSIAAARYATAHPDHIARLALYAPLYSEPNPTWLGLIAGPGNPMQLRSDVGEYRSIALSDLTHRWDNEIGDHVIGDYRESGVLECAFQTLWSLNRHVRADGVPAFRCPTGPLFDLLNVFNGRRLYDAAQLTMPALLVRGSDDITSTDSDARSLLRDIRSRVKSYAVIPCASHFLLLEKKRTALYQLLDAFFEPLKEPRRSLEEDIL